MRQFQKIFKLFEDRINEILKFVSLVSQQKVFTTKIFGDEQWLHDQLSSESYVLHSRDLLNSKVQYNAIIISTYACFENYIDDLLKEYISSIIQNGIKLEDISPTSSKTYKEKVVDYLSNPHRFPIDLYDEKTVIKSFFDCYHEDNTSLIPELFLHHGGNLRETQIKDLLRITGVLQNSDLADSGDVKDFADEYIKDPDFLNALFLKPSIITQCLDEIVEQRNRIAHSWSSENRLGEIPLINHIKTIQFLGRVLLSHVELAFVKTRKPNLFRFSKIIEVYKHQILCLNTENEVLAIGDMLYFEGQDVSGIAHIRRIEIEKQSVVSTKGDCADVGIELDRRVKKDFIYYSIHD